MEEIAVLGGGNLAHTCAADLSLAGYKVNMYDLPQFREKLEAIIKNDGITISGKARVGLAELNKATTNIKETVKGVDLVLIAVPAFAHRIFAETCLPYLESGQIVVFLGKGGASLEFARVKKELGISKEIIIGETNTCPYGTRLVGPAQIKVFSTVKEFKVAAFPARDNSKVVVALKEIYKSAAQADNVLETMLGDINAVIHPAPMILGTSRIEYSPVMWKECLSTSVFKVMKAVDKERLNLAETLGLRRIPFSELYFTTGYSTRKGTLEETLMNAMGMDILKAPPNLQHRYIAEDVPYGLVPWAGLGNLCNVSTPIVNSLITIASTINQTDYWKEGRTLEKMGISGLSIDELIEYVDSG